MDVHWCGRCAIVGILGRVLPFRGMADYRLAHQFHSLLETPTLFWWLECTCRMCDG